MQNRFFRIILLLVGLLYFTAVAFSDDGFVSLPALVGRIVDDAHILDQQTYSELDQLLESVEKEKGAQVVVLTLPTTQPEEISQFGIRLAEKWKIGRKKIDDGAILIVAKEDRRVRIEVGYGLEGALPDATAKRIIESAIIPEFKKGNFALGIKQGVTAIVAVVRGELLPLPDQTDQASPMAIIILFIVALIAIVLMEIFCPGLLGVLTAISMGSGNNDRGGGGFSGGGGSFGGGGASGSW